jgi:hypothetical protein
VIKVSSLLDELGPASTAESLTRNNPLQTPIAVHAEYYPLVFSLGFFNPIMVSSQRPAQTNQISYIFAEELGCQ